MSHNYHTHQPPTGLLVGITDNDYSVAWEYRISSENMCVFSQCIKHIRCNVQGMSLDSLMSCLLLLCLIKVTHMILHVIQASIIKNVHFPGCNRTFTLGKLSTTEGREMWLINGIAIRYDITFTFWALIKRGLRSSEPNHRFTVSVISTMDQDFK